MNFTLDAGLDQAGRNYIILGGITGTDPGTPLPGGLVTLPVNWDVFTNLVLMYANTPVFTSFMGSLDAQGGATAQLNAPPVPAAAGATLAFAFALNKPWDFVSNPVLIEMTP